MFLSQSSCLIALIVSITPSILLPSRTSGVRPRRPNPWYALIVVLLLFLGGCGGGGDDGDSPGDARPGGVTPGPVSSLKIGLLTASSAPDGIPVYAISGSNGRITYRATSDGTILQAHHISTSTTPPVAVTVFYDEETGSPRTVYDWATGNWLSIRKHGSNRVDVWAYDKSGNYQGGFALYEEGGQYFMGEIVGIPALEGRQITGQLNPTSASWMGSFSLMGDIEDGLTNVQALSAEQARFIESLTPSGTALATVHDKSH